MSPDDDDLASDYINTTEKKTTKLDRTLRPSELLGDKQKDYKDEKGRALLEGLHKQMSGKQQSEMF